MTHDDSYWIEAHGVEMPTNGNGRLAIRDTYKSMLAYSGDGTTCMSLRIFAPPCGILRPRLGALACVQA